MNDCGDGDRPHHSGNVGKGEGAGTEISQGPAKAEGRWIRSGFFKKGRKYPFARRWAILAVSFSCLLLDDEISLR